MNSAVYTYDTDLIRRLRNREYAKHFLSQSSSDFATFKIAVEQVIASLEDELEEEREKRWEWESAYRLNQSARTCSSAVTVGVVQRDTPVLAQEGKRAVSDYTSLPYTITLRKDNEGDFVARIEELRGCVAHGSTEAEAIAALRQVQSLWVESRIESGQPIPEPYEEEQLSTGKWVQRVPRSNEPTTTKD